MGKLLFPISISEILGLEIAFKSFYKRYEKLSISRGYKFSITYQQFFDLMRQNCVYCGQEPRTKIGKLKRNGIDRVDNKIGYVLENCVTCCGTCNIWKGKKSQEDFIQHAQKIVKYQKKRLSDKQYLSAEDAGYLPNDTWS